MKPNNKIVSHFFFFVILTVITQIGGIVYLLSLYFFKKVTQKFRFKRIIVFSIIYLIATFIIVPLIAPVFGREKVKHSIKIRPANYATVLMNRNYVAPKVNNLLANAEKELTHTKIGIRYLDANFPFINKFPLLPHLSHNDGKKIDLSFIYKNKQGEISTKQKSISGYGVFEVPLKGEKNQTNNCLKKGHFQYDYTKYASLGKINSELVFSEIGTKKLIKSLLKSEFLEKIFIEPHLKERLGLKDSRVRFHGCKAVRHDDHIHIQVR